MVVDLNVLMQWACCIPWAVQHAYHVLQVAQSTAGVCTWQIAGVLAQSVMLVLVCGCGDGSQVQLCHCQLQSPAGNLPGSNRCLDSRPTDSTYLMSLLLLVVLLDFLVPQAHLLDCLPVHLCMICWGQPLPTDFTRSLLALLLEEVSSQALAYRRCESL